MKRLSVYGIYVNNSYVCVGVLCVLCVVCCLREVRGRAGSLGRRAYTHYTPKPV